MILPQEHPTLSPHTVFGLPPHTTTLSTTIGNSGYVFVVRFRSFTFVGMFYSYVSKIQLSSNDPTTGMPKTQPTDWVWHSLPHNCLANKGQQWVCFCGEFRSFTFLQMCYSYASKTFQFISYGPTNRKSKTQLNLATCPTPLPCQQQ